MSKYLNSVDLKWNTITQKKFLTSEMSPGVQHTPLPSTSSSKEPEVMEMKLLVKEEINNAINLRQLYAVTTAFLEKKNIRTEFPYYLDAEKVLALYGRESRLSKLFPNLVPRNLFPKEQTKVSICSLFLLFFLGLDIMFSIRE